MRTFLASRGITLPEGEPGRPAGRGHRQRRRQPQERRAAASGSAPTASRSTRARWRTCRRRATPGCAGRSSRPAPTAGDVVAAAGLEPTARGPGGRGGRPRARGCAASRTRTRSWPRRQLLGVDARRRPPSSRTRSPASRPAGPAASATWSASTGSGQADELRAHGADIVVDATWPSCLTSEGTRMIRERAYPVEPWHVRETRLDLDVLAQSESVFALSNGHIGLRGNLDEGEPHGLPGTYLNSFYELRPLPYAEAGLRLPRVRPDDRQRHQRQADPAAGRRRAVRRALRRAARPRAGPRPAGRHAAPGGATGARRPAGRSRSAAPGWSRSPSGRSPPSATRWRPVDGPLRLIVQSELVANEALPAQSTRPPGGGGAGVAAAGRGGARPPTTGGAADPPHQGQRAAGGRRDGPRRRRPGAAPPSSTEGVRGLGPHHRRLRARARRDAAGGQVPRVRLVEPAVAAGAARPGRRGAGRRPARRLGRAAPRAAGRTSTSSGTPPTCGSRATRRCSRRSGSGCSTCSRPAPGPSSGRSRRRG